MSKPKAPWPVTVAAIAVTIVVITLGIIEDRRNDARVAERAVHSEAVQAAMEAARSAAEASYGETPKPEDHGR